MTELDTNNQFQKAKSRSTRNTCQETKKNGEKRQPRNQPEALVDPEVAEAPEELPEEAEAPEALEEPEDPEVPEAAEAPEDLPEVLAEDSEAAPEVAEADMDTTNKTHTTMTTTTMNIMTTANGDTNKIGDILKMKRRRK